MDGEPVSRGSSTWSRRSTRRWSTELFLRPPYWMGSSGMAPLRSRRSMLSRIFHRNGVQLMFLQSPKESVVGTMGWQPLFPSSNGRATSRYGTRHWRFGLLGQPAVHGEPWLPWLMSTASWPGGALRPLPLQLPGTVVLQFVLGQQHQGPGETTAYGSNKSTKLLIN